MSRDAKALAKLYDDDGNFVLPDGRLVDKQDYIADIVRRKYQTAQTSDQKVRAIAESVVIEAGVFTCSGTEQNGQPFRERHRCSGQRLQQAIDDGAVNYAAAEAGQLV